ncbi:hypothetical protein U8V72_27425 [Priestia filamentosa]|uniref:hypothetical protein n=1 Tax=Priestia filamentosa TaxID=1402861 RepID=UPI0039797E63
MQQVEELKYITMLMDDYDEEMEKYLLSKGINVIEKDERNEDMVLVQTLLTKKEIMDVGCIVSVYSVK